MNTKTLTLDQYTRDRRRLNTRLGLLMVMLIPLPAILLHVQFEPLQMLATVAVLAVGVGIVYPVWWRSKHHPYREDGREKRARLIAVTCRTVAFISLVGFMVSWVMGSGASSWIALAFLVAGAAAFIVGIEVVLDSNILSNGISRINESARTASCFVLTVPALISFLLFLRFRDSLFDSDGKAFSNERIAGSLLAARCGASRLQNGSRSGEDAGRALIGDFLLGFQPVLYVSTAELRAF